MKAILCRAISDDIASVKLEDLALPPLGPADVRLKMRAASVNFPDLLMIQGKYQLKPPLPFTPGKEGCGEVVEKGAAVSNVDIGDRVVAGMRYGAYAEEVVVPAATVRKAPAALNDAEVASYGAAYLTAWVGLVCRGLLQKGETLLVHGASGGVGLAAVDLGKQLGATVIATASTPQKRAFLKDYGADHVLEPAGFREPVKELTGGRGANVVYDPVGGDVFDESVRCIAFDGRLVVIGFAGGRIPTISVNMPLIKGFSVVGARAGEYGRQFPERGKANIAAIDTLAAEGKLRPHIHARFPLSEAVAAMQTLARREVIGKTVIEMGGG
ncbi:MAG: zinc-binding dehydrogenase [Alphaproteobacteria bacterium]|nr:zinc-binding dehydrogenase [Alphaproteobacteria bacterium]